MQSFLVGSALPVPAAGRPALIACVRRCTVLGGSAQLAEMRRVPLTAHSGLSTRQQRHYQCCAQPDFVDADFMQAMNEASQCCLLPGL